MLGDILSVAILGALIGLDVTAFGQFMISQPIVAGPIFGFVLGDMKTGLWVGMITEMLWVRVIPMGAAIPHNITAITVFTIFWGSKAGGSASDGVYILALAIAVVLSMLFKPLDIWVRYLNVKIAHWVEENVKNGNEDALVHGVTLGVFVFFVRSFVFYLVLLYPGAVITRTIYSKLPFVITSGLDLCWLVLPVVGFATVLYNFHSRFFHIKL